MDPAAAGLTGDFKTAEQQDPMLTSQVITVEAIRIAALVNEPPKRFLDIDKTLIVVNGEIFEHLAPEATYLTWPYEEMARADTLICGSQTVVDNMYEILDTEKERRLNDDLTHRALATCCVFPFLVGQPKPIHPGILRCLTFVVADYVAR